MCDEANRAVNQTPQATAQVTAHTAVRKDSATATPQVATAATATAKDTARKDVDSKKAQVADSEFARAENEDDDGYDPYSDRRPVSEPLFERDPWS